MEAIKAVPEKHEAPKEKPSGIRKSHNCVLILLTHKTKCSFPGQISVQDDQTKVVPFKPCIKIYLMTLCFSQT